MWSVIDYVLLYGIPGFVDGIFSKHVQKLKDVSRLEERFRPLPLSSFFLQWHESCIPSCVTIVCWRVSASMVDTTRSERVVSRASFYTRRETACFVSYYASPWCRSRNTKLKHTLVSSFKAINPPRSFSRRNVTSSIHRCVTR